MVRRSSIVQRAIIIGSAGVVVACGMVAGIDDLVIGDCKGGACVSKPTDASDAGVEDVSAEEPRDGAIPPDDSGLPCVGKPLPQGIRVGAPGNTFCIDTTEVTNAQYKQFLDANVAPGSQPPICSWNASFAPAAIDAGPDVPVVGVDWCDALAYCTWAEKYLCGKVVKGKKTGAVTDRSDYTSHQWLNACTADGRFAYPYGGSYVRGKCNFAELDAGGPIPVGTAPGCEGGYAGLHDLSGNVWEWYDGPCKDPGDGGPQNQQCSIVGGGFDNTGPEWNCNFEIDFWPRNKRQANVGFRCCSD